MGSFNRTTIVSVLVLCVNVIVFIGETASAQGESPGSAYAFVYLGDMHFDKKSHHDFEWVTANKPNDLRQIEDYVRITETYTPGLLERVQTAIDSSHGQIKMVIQGGDLTEGLCGSRELQETQFRDVISLIQNTIPETTFMAVKGNHDITGPGAREAFDNVMLPWLSKACEKPIHSASFHVMQGPDLFVFFDAYHDRNLDWLEETLDRNKHRYAFVVIHTPVVPYNARSTWHLFSKDNEREVRERFLNILGANQVVLLTAHLHRYHVLARKTSKGTFVQFSVNSVINTSEVLVKNPREGIQAYGSSLVELEPDFQPDTKQNRQKMLEDEKPYVTYFDYANFPGYAIVNVSDAGINIDVYKGDSDKVWKNVPLSTVLNH